MIERFFFDNGQIKVTNARFITLNQTFAINAINSVGMYVKNPNRFGPIFTIIISIIALFFGISFIYSSYEIERIEIIRIPGIFVITLGSILLILAIIWICLQRSIYYVRIQTSSGTSNALSSTDRDLIQQIVNALNEAIISQAK